MALRIVNTTPGDVGEPLLPGRPVVFSLKSETDNISIETLAVKLGSTNCAHRSDGVVGLLPESNETLLKTATVSLRSPEHHQPVDGEIPRAPDGLGFTIGPGPSSGLQACVYEVSSDIETYAPIMASVSFKVRASWGKRSYFWSDLDSLAPIYLGLEYGVRNTGIFAFLRDDGGSGSLVVGGPLQAFSTTRPSQVELPFPWLDLPDESIVSVLFDINPELQTLQVWGQMPTDSGPVMLGPEIPIGTLGEFLDETTAFPQRRAGPSPSATLYFGNGGDNLDIVDIVDYALFRNYPQAVDSAYPRPGHTLRRRPDLPYTFFSSDRALPTDASIGRWNRGGFSPTVSFWYQPGRRSTPLYAKIFRSLGTGYVRRSEPRLAGRTDGFSVEAWMAGEIELRSSIDTGFGLRVGDGLTLFQVTGLETDLAKTYGILKDQLSLGKTEGYWMKTLEDGTIAPADFTSLRFVRLTVDRYRNKVALFVEDPNTPFLEVPLDQANFPASSEEPFIDFGILGDTTYPATLKLASISYMNRYLAWEVADGTPDNNESNPIPWSIDAGGDVAISIEEGSLRVLNTATELEDYAVYRRAGDFTYLRGFQVDFWARSSIPNDPPGVWAGTGVTVYLGTVDSPNTQAFKIHVGFFDCGPYGKKVAIVPKDGYDDILKQTVRGQKHSAALDWTQEFSGASPMQNLRLVYRPFHAVELWGQGLIKDAPLISIPWDEFEHELDLQEQTPSIAFGNFTAEHGCTSEWRYVRWGISTGYDIELTQNISSPELVMGGRTFVAISAEEEETGGGV